MAVIAVTGVQWFIVGGAPRLARQAGQAASAAQPTGTVSNLGTGTAPRVAPLPQPSIRTQHPLGAIVPARMIIPKVHVNAPVVQKDIDGHNVMEAPSSPDQVAWYPFSAEPGAGSNAVFSGHLDFAGRGPAVFWRLHELRAGDPLELEPASGPGYRYRVTSVQTYDANTGAVAEIIGPTAVDSVTLITCEGTYSKRSGYSERLIVRAQIEPTGA